MRPAVSLTASPSRSSPLCVAASGSPTNPALLGLNVGGGVEVKLRLRRPGREWDFFPFEQVLDTMLHELCHIVHGPHNASFYKLWDELRKECDELVAKGITGTGQGFDTLGRRLGGFSVQPSVSSLRQAAVDAAAKRARTGALLPSGPNRLGGNSEIMGALSPIQAAAMAAERRLYDDIWCGSVSEEINLIESITEISKHPAPEIGESSNSNGEKKGDLGGTGKIEKGWTNLHSKGKGEESTSSITFDRATMPGGSMSPYPKHDTDDKVIWECSKCTLFNQPLGLTCEACGAPKPKAAESKFKTWSCKFCTLENSTKQDKCSACGQWRYSYGPPLDT
ncbi:uncharacterized protein LOC122005119 isoform X3 [Zingiber officinale]|uniref:uncharacterized protein LOC122000829 isoform X2 n=1 Tax=Zingiber officinale TaxID=94328 RepID=UPI001C4BD4A2|nr:uncharacterized protein LOC122000829 isoform X2 [Zingiber officinale]XP_042415975.1 uncharacterized protein LOC122005119 isoform X3 [Zingiber officinale]